MDIEKPLQDLAKEKGCTLVSFEVLGTSFRQVICDAKGVRHIIDGHLAETYKIHNFLMQQEPI